MQLFGRVATVGVHLDKHRVVTTQTPGETCQVRRTEAVFGGPVQHVGTAAVRLGELVGKLAGSVGAAVVHDQHVDIGTGVLESSVDDREVVQLVEGGDDHQYALAWPIARDRGCLLADGHVAPSSRSPWS